MVCTEDVRRPASRATHAAAVSRAVAALDLGVGASPASGWQHLTGGGEHLTQGRELHRDLTAHHGHAVTQLLETHGGVASADADRRDADRRDADSWGKVALGSPDPQLPSRVLQAEQRPVTLHEAARHRSRIGG